MINPMYAILKKLLFALDPEQSHSVAMRGMQLTQQMGLSRFLTTQTPSQPRTVMGIVFPNAVGLAAGLDKNADYVDALAALGFGFIEVGTVTPRPQTGNIKPRLFRSLQEEAIINRMGFNNKGADYVNDRLSQTKYRGVLGINIGKNRDTPVEKADEDYVYCFKQLADFATYITINISSPNTEGLRALQHGELLAALLKKLKTEQAAQKRYIPLVVKIAPDLTPEELQEIARILLEHKIDGVIATNTTLNRDGLSDSRFAQEAGGLSGRPLLKRSTAILQELKNLTQDKIPLIASGGVMDAHAAQEKFQAGAKLVQVYSGFIYQGPDIIRQIVSAS
jgi:dihydroorotate dehydrogenase